MQVIRILSRVQYIFMIPLVIVSYFVCDPRTYSMPLYSIPLKDNNTYLMASTPPMGWNPWNSFGCNVDENLIIHSASLIKKLGLLSAGYRTISLDDCWMSPLRNDQGDLVPNATRFPHGIKNLVSRLHSMGFKVGIYASPNKNTCEIRNAGSEGHYLGDARLFVTWGIDFLKFDLCKSDENIHDQISYFSQMRSALLEALSSRRKKGLPGSSTLVYSINPNSIFNWNPNPNPPVLSPYPPGLRYKWGSMSNAWRIAYDIKPIWHNRYKDLYHRYQGIADMISMAIKSVNLGMYSTRNHWMDLDMLEVGNGKLTYTENKTHFLMWALFSSPLFLGFNLTKVSNEILRLMKNPRIIAIDQSIPVGPIKIFGNYSFIRKLPRNLGRYLIVQYNATNKIKKITTHLPGPSKKILVEVFSGMRKTITSSSLTNMVPPHGVSANIIN